MLRRYFIVPIILTFIWICLGISFAFLFVSILVAFIWGAIGSATVVSCVSQRNWFPALTAYTVLDMVISFALAIWVPIQLCCWMC